jgi:lysine-N-methylase
MVAGRGRVPAIQATFPTVPFSALERDWPALGQEPAAAVARYYRVRIGAFGFFGPACGGRPFAYGLTALALTYPAVLWFARLFAAGDGAGTIGLEHAVRAIQVVDHRYGRSTRLEAAADARRREALCDIGTLTRLIVWYGGVEETAAPA